MYFKANLTLFNQNHILYGRKYKKIGVGRRKEGQYSI